MKFTKLTSLTLLSFFICGKRAISGERFFWKDPSDKAVIIGLGISKQIQSDQATDRFFHVEKEWKQFLEDAIILQSISEIWVGPTMFGGFSFDPLKAKTNLWSKFRRFIIPSS